jgi:hypothetical protein
MVTYAATVTQIAMVALTPRRITAGTLLLCSNSVRTAKKTLHHYKDRFLTLFEEIMAENHKKHKTTDLQIVKQVGQYLILGLKALKRRENL